MVAPESIVISGSNAQEILGTYGKILSQLAPEVRLQMAAVMKKYLSIYSFDEICEQLKGRTVAQILAEIPPDELKSMVQSRFVWQEVRTTALTGSAPAIMALSCPKCGGALSVRFDPSSPQSDGTTAGFLIISCLGCSSGCCADGLNETPPWVESLGLSITTEASNG